MIKSIFCRHCDYFVENVQLKNITGDFCFGGVKHTIHKTEYQTKFRQQILYSLPDFNTALPEKDLTWDGFCYQNTITEFIPPGCPYRFEIEILKP